MIHIATIHWPTVKWIGIQQNYLRKNLISDFKNYTVISESSDLGVASFDYVHKTNQSDHSQNLNHLLDVVLEAQTSENDILIFLDGDAFPVSPLDLYLEDRLSKNPLIAIQRYENAGEFIPHPSFCAARIGIWEELGTVWGKGRNIKDYGRDPGAGLYEALIEKGINWGKLHRTNKMNLHPVFFGIYDQIIYHHGAGFRDPITRSDLEDRMLESKRNQFITKFIELLPNSLFVKFKRRISPFRRMEYDRILANQQLHNSVFNQIMETDEFYKNFI